MSAFEILHFVKAADCYLNVSIAYQILLTILVTVASAERSFSKLKLLKKNLRSTMLQERLNSLAMCSIEKDILDKIDLDIVLEDFASGNARRRFFKKHRSTIVLFEVSIIVILPFFQLLRCTIIFFMK